MSTKHKTETMVELRLEGSYSTNEIVGLVLQAKEAPIVTKLYISEVALNETLIRALVDLFSTTRRTQGRRWEKVTFVRCTGPVHLVVAEMSQSNVTEFHFFDHDDGNSADFRILSNPTLLRTSLGNMVLTKEMATNLAWHLATNTSLRSFGLSRCRLDPDAVPVLANGFRHNYHLQQVQISDCYLPDQHLAMLVHALEANVSLESLHVNGNYCRSQGMEAITNLALSKSTQLMDLDISDQFGPDDEGNSELNISCLVKALQTSISLKRFGARECNLRDKDMADLVHLLCTNSSIEDVDLRYNYISAEGIKTIFAANLGGMKGLKRIFLRQGRGILHEDVRDALLKGMGGNMCLESLDLFQWAEEMEMYFDLNRAGRCLLKEQDLPRSLWPIVFERVQHTINQNGGCEKGTRRMRKDAIRKANVHYHLLRHGPILFER